MKTASRRYNILMYIQNKPASALYKMFIGVLAMVGFWLLINEFGLSSWRLFSTYVTLTAAVYFLLSAVIIALSKKRDAGQIPCPMLEGMLIVCFSLLCAITVVCHLGKVTFPGASGWNASLIYFVLPFLALSDWVLFTKKGRWRIGYPFYWLAPALSYAALIILTAPNFSVEDPLRYPISFLNFYDNGLVEMMEWFCLIAVLVLVYGYVLLLINYAASGKISKYIVLPRIKTIVLEEDPEPEVKAEPKIERIEVKLEPMEQPAAKKTSNKRNAGAKANSGSRVNKSKRKNTDGVKSKKKKNNGYVKQP